MSYIIRRSAFCATLFFALELLVSTGCPAPVATETTTETTTEAIIEASTETTSTETGSEKNSPEPTKPEPTKPEPTKPEPTKPEPTTPDSGPDANEPPKEGNAPEFTPDTKAEILPETRPDTPETRPDTPEISPEPTLTTFNLQGTVVKFTVASQPGFPDVKACAHASIKDVSAGTFLKGTSCAVSSANGKYTISNVPYNTKFYVSLTSNGPNSGSKDLFPTVTALYVTKATQPTYLPFLRVALVTKTEAALIGQLLQVQVDIVNKGVLVVDAQTNRVTPVAGVAMTLYPSQPNGVTGPIYLAPTLTGVPGTTGTTAAGTALFANMPAGSYGVGFAKTGVNQCSAYPTTPATLNPCKAGAVTGTSDCAAVDIIAGWMTVSASGCPK